MPTITRTGPRSYVLTLHGYTLAVQGTLADALRAGREMARVHARVDWSLF